MRYFAMFMLGFAAGFAFLHFAMVIIRNTVRNNNPYPRRDSE